MIKMLHTADWHMDAPLRSFTPEQRITLRREMLLLPGKIADLCLKEACDLVLLSGDIFDSMSYTAESVAAVRNALIRMAVPVFVAAGNHDYWGERSPWSREEWPPNVYFFQRPQISAFRMPKLNCRIYGAGFDYMECPGLLDNFHAECEEKHAIMVLHGDPVTADSPYCPVTVGQVRDSGFDYVALGHIHTAGKFQAGESLCAWPGCPMGHGFDETGIKGVLIVEIGEKPELRFLPLDVPRFYEVSVEAGEDPESAVAGVLPGGGSEDHYRVRLTGACPGVDTEQLLQKFARYPNLTILDETIKVASLWDKAGEDTLEGIYFQILRDALRKATDQEREDLELAAKLSRDIMAGQEVTLP